MAARISDVRKAGDAHQVDPVLERCRSNFD